MVCVRIAVCFAVVRYCVGWVGFVDGLLFLLMELVGLVMTVGVTVDEGWSLLLLLRVVQNAPSFGWIMVFDCEVCDFWVCKFCFALGICLLMKRFCVTYVKWVVLRDVW